MVLRDSGSYRVSRRGSPAPDKKKLLNIPVLVDFGVYVTVNEFAVCRQCSAGRSNGGVAGIRP